MAKVNLCSGECCKQFTLPYSYGFIKRAWMSWRSGDEFIWYGKKRSRPHDIDILFPMLIPLSRNQTNESSGVSQTTRRYIYTCKHFNTKDKICMFYEFRPTMCKQYPYGGICTYKGCRFTGHGSSTRKVKLVSSTPA